MSQTTPAVGRAADARLSLFIATAICMALGTAPRSPACGNPAPPPFCGAQLAIVKAVPNVILVPPGGVNFNVPVLVFFNIFGSGCPEPPYTVDITININCALGPPVQAMVQAQILPGFQVVNVPVAIPGGGPLPDICTVQGCAVMNLPLGAPPVATQLKAVGDTLVCLAEPLPGTTDVPRIDLQLIGPEGSEIQRVHPGGQAEFRYLVTNNDPDNAFLGDLTIVSRNGSRQPQVVSPEELAAAGGGAFAVSDPVEGDDFPIAFRDGLDPLGCVPLPVDPHASVSPEITTAIELSPEESIEIEFFTRPWGMCANGSCGEITLALQGGFGQINASGEFTANPGDEGLACAGVIVAADTSQPPDIRWPDSGVVPHLLTGSPITFEVSVPPTDVIDPFSFEIHTPFGLLSDDAQPPNFYDGQPFISPLGGPEYSRSQFQFINSASFGDPLFQGTNPLAQFQSQVFLVPTDGYGIDLMSIDVIPGIPTGFDNINPVAIGQAHIDQQDPFIVDSFFDIYFQISVSGVEGPLTGGRRFNFEIENVELRPFVPPPSDGNDRNTPGFLPGYDVLVAARVPAGIDASEVRLAELYTDFRGFIRPDAPAPTDEQPIVDFIIGRPVAPTEAFNTNMDDRVDSGDVVTIINAP